MATTAKNVKRFFGDAMNRKPITIIVDREGHPVQEKDDSTLAIQVATSISTENMHEFVNECVAMAFDDLGAHRPELFDLSVAKCVLKYYTDLNGTLDNDELRKIVYNTDLYQTIYEAMPYGGKMQIDMLANASRSVVDWKLRYEASFIKFQIDSAVSKLESVLRKWHPSLEMPMSRMQFSLWFR